MMTNHRLPGIRSFIRRNAMFRPIEMRTAGSAAEIVAMAHEAMQCGKLRAGDAFPVPDELAKHTGSRLADSVDAVATLLQERSIRQQASGRLLVARRMAR
ncbi:hypothetical protein N9044_00315 [bacterium]|nr:hypothetical protein [bacterium]MDB4502238.1 hypothetical protein [Akkermansiaceae bacterium]